MNKIFLTDGVNVENCEYYEPVGGVEYQGMWEFTDCCYKYYKHCYDKKICPYKIKQLFLHPIKVFKRFIDFYKSERLMKRGSK